MGFEIQKKNQAVNTRLGMGALLALIGYSFCYAVFGWFIDKSFFGLVMLGRSVSWGHVLSILVGIGYTVLMLWLLLFNERAVDFLIKVDREIKKVTWPAWDQLKNSVFVILGVIVFFGLIVSVYDIIFTLGIWQGLLGIK